MTNHREEPLADEEDTVLDRGGAEPAGEADPARSPVFSAGAASSGDDPTLELPESPETDEVYVLLPEGEEGAIPVVETEVVDEDAGTGAEEALDSSLHETQPVDASEADLVSSAEESLLDGALVPTQDITSSADRLVSEGEGDDAGESSSGDDRLEAIASELDVDSGSESDPVAQDEDGMGDTAALEQDLAQIAAEAEGATALDTSTSPGSEGRFGRKAVWAAAAACLLAAGLGLYVWLGQSDTHPALATSVPTPTNVTPAVTPPVDPAVPSPVEPVTEDAALASARRTFREKMHLSLELGFVGEVRNE